MSSALTRTVVTVLAAALVPGQADPSFGSGGLVRFDPSRAAPTNAFINDVALDAQGRILVTGGAADDAGRQALHVARFLPDGRPGVVFQQLGAGSTPYGDVAALAIGPGSSVHAASSASVGVSNQAELALTRLGASGQLDGSFGPGGTRRLRLHACDGNGYCGTNVADLLVDAAGRVLVLMTVWEGTNRHHAVARYLPTGLLDTTFGTDGVASGPTVGLESASAMVPTGAGRLVLAGSDGSRSSTAVLRRLTTEPVADPPPAPAVVPVDRTAPVLGSPAVTTVRKKRRSTLALTSSEAARLSVTLEQARAGRRAKGKGCSAKARTGRA